MTEAEAISALTDIGEVAGTYGGLWVSSTFAYLMVCYFVGKALTTFQCLVISVLYGTSGLMFAGAALGYSNSWLLLRSRERTIFDEVWLFAEIDYYSTMAGVVLFGGVFVSLYFMYNIRKQEPN